VGVFQPLPSLGEAAMDFSGDGGISSKPRDYKRKKDMLFNK